MQNRILSRQKLLNIDGHLANPGYATEPLYDYNRADIKASVWRIKEWDYYAILQEDIGVSFTISDLGYSALIGVVFFDFANRRVIKKTKLLWFVFGKMKMPTTSLEGDVTYCGDGFDLKFERHEHGRHLSVSVIDFYPGFDFKSDVWLEDLKDDSMVIATPWDANPKAFYYNQKINCMPATGTIIVGPEKYELETGKAFGVLDWGRGVWTYKNTWYWSSASGMVAGKRFGFNLGYGFGNTSKATENILFYDGEAHKLDQVTFEIDPTDFLKPWKFTSNDHRLELVMEPIIDREDNLNFVIIKNLGHQVFGKFYGYVILDDGTRLEIANLLGFAEKITNHY